MTTAKFSGTDYRYLLDAMIDAYEGKRGQDGFPLPIEVNGTLTFRKTKSKGAGTLHDIVSWFEKNHAEEIERIRESVKCKAAA